MRSIEKSGRSFVPQPAFRVGVDLIDLDIPPGSMVAAGEAIHEHIGELAKDLTSIMRTQVLAPFRSSQHTAEEARAFRSEEHTSELQSLMRISYAVFCLKTKT